MDEEKKAKLERLAGAVRTGGKGTVRRKRKAIHKTGGTDDKRLQNTLKRLNVNTIPGIEEVLITRDDNTTISFANPKVQASVNANTYVISGPSHTKKSSDIPIMAFQNSQELQRQLEAMNAGKLNGAAGGDDDEEDDDAPDLVENFEEDAK